MQISIRIPQTTNDRLQLMASKTGKTKTALILEAVNEKYNLKKGRAQLIHELAGWMSPDECAELRNAIEDFNVVNDQDWP